MFVLWERFALLAIFPDETTDVEESSTAAVFVVSPGSLPQEPDGQADGYTQNDRASDDESGDVKRGVGRTAATSGEEDVNGLRGHQGNWALQG